MLIFMIIGCLAAKARRMRILPIFRDRSLIPLAICELTYICFEICIFAGEYGVVKYSSAIQTAFLLSTLFPIMKHKLYYQAIAGFGMVLAGTLLNKLAINANGGIMPVHPTLSKFTGYFTTEAVGVASDGVHALMNEGTKLKFLCDYIDIGYSILSPGDVIIHAYAALLMYFVVKRNNGKTNMEVNGDA